MPETKPKAPLTPEELRWRAAARDPDKAKRNLKLQYILLRCAIAASIGWGIYLFRTDVISRSDWLGALGIALSLVSILLGIVNTGVFWWARGPGAISDPLSPQQKPR